MADLSQFSDADLARMQGVASLQAMPDDQLHALAGQASPGNGMLDLGAMSRADSQRRMDAMRGLSAPGAATGILKGIRDPIDAGAQLLVHSLPDGVVNTVNKVADATPFLPAGATQQQIDQGIAENEKAYQAKRAENGATGFDTGRMIGNVAGTLPLSRLLPVARTLMGAPVTGAIGGGVYGALNPVTDQGQGFWDQKLGQMKTGAIAGGIAAPLGMAASRIISPQVDPNVQMLMDRGVTPTPGQILGGTPAVLEDKATSIPFVGDLIKNAQRRGVDQFNRATFNDILAPIGQRSEGAIGHEAFADAERKLGGAYDNLLPNLTFRADQQLVSDINTLRSTVANSTLSDVEKRQFTDVLRNKVVPKLAPAGIMDGQTFKGMESELTNLARGYGKDTSFDKRQLGDAIGEVLTSMRGALERSNPGYAGQLAPINQGWAMLTRARTAASRVGAEEGAFTPAQLLSAVRAGDQSVGKGAMARGTALMQPLAEAGKAVLGSKYPDSGTAGRYLLGSAGAAALGHVSPWVPLGALGAAIPYSRPGQWTLAQLLANRPAGAAPLAAALEQGISPGVAGLTGAIIRQPGLPLSLAPNLP